MPIGRKAIAKVNHNGELEWPWKRWFKRTKSFTFQRGVIYTLVEQSDKFYVIDRAYIPHEFDFQTLKTLFRINL